MHHQIIEQARDCLQKSKDKMISGDYFFSMSENVERLLEDVSVHVYRLLEHIIFTMKLIKCFACTTMSVCVV